MSERNKQAEPIAEVVDEPFFENGVIKMIKPLRHFGAGTKLYAELPGTTELVEAALNMVDVKGRHHSEIAMNRLIEAAKKYRSAT